MLIWRRGKKGLLGARTHAPRLRVASLRPQDNIFEWHFVIRGAWDSEFEVRGASSCRRYCCSQLDWVLRLGFRGNM